MIERPPAGEPESRRLPGGRLGPDRFRELVSLILTVGVTVSGALMAVAFVSAIAVGWDGSLLGRTPLAGGAPTDFGTLAARLADARPIGLAQLGLLLLLATPVARVAASVVGFALEGDRLYVGITLAVLGVLLASIFLVR